MVKILFLPHCLEKELRLRISELAKVKGYLIYIVPGGSQVKKVVEDLVRTKEIEKIVGIACKDEVELAKKYFKGTKLKDKVFAICLSKDGCKDTRVDLEEVERIL